MASAAERQDRDRQILVARAEGQSAEQIASAWGIGSMRVRQILAAGVTNLQDDGQLDPVQVVYERRAQLKAEYEAASELAESIPIEASWRKSGS